MTRLSTWIAAVCLGAVACGGPGAGTTTTVFLGARIIDGTGAAPVDDGAIVVIDGRIAAIGSRGRVVIPANGEHVDLTGLTVMPGLVNAHGHVGATAGDATGDSLRVLLSSELQTYARYGVTAVVSLGGEGPEAAALRSEESDPSFARARLLIAGAVVTGATEEEIRAAVDDAAALAADFIKIRVDDNLGTTTKMSPPLFTAAISQAHRYELPLAAHLFYLDDGKALLDAGIDLVAHSVRDQPVDVAFVQSLRERDVCYVPTLTREVSTFVYETRPDFFDDPFFARGAFTETVRVLEDPDRQAGVRASAAAQAYKQALAVAKTNVKRVIDGGGTVALGTDTGPFGRFQGYFEHLEMALMAEAGLTPAQIVRAATGAAAACVGWDDVGTLEVGKWADFVALTADPLADITNTRRIASVWVSGNYVPGS